MTPAGIEPATHRFVAQRLNHCATAVPGIACYRIKYSTVLRLLELQIGRGRKV